MKRKQTSWRLRLFMAGLLLLTALLVHLGSHLFVLHISVSSPPSEYGEYAWRGVVPLVLTAFRPNHGAAKVPGIEVQLGWVHAFAQARWPEAFDPGKHDDVEGDDTPEREWKDWWRELGDWCKKRGRR